MDGELREVADIYTTYVAIRYCPKSIAINRSDQTDLRILLVS